MICFGLCFRLLIEIGFIFWVQKLVFGDKVLVLCLQFGRWDFEFESMGFRRLEAWPLGMEAINRSFNKQVACITNLQSTEGTQGKKKRKGERN